MSKKIAIVNFKGGVGKTTTAAYLAHAYARTGAKVAVVDTDPQESLMAWAGVVEDWAIPRFSLDARATQFARRLEDLTGECDVVIIDTPPFAEDLDAPGAAVLRWVDQVVVPMSPSTADMPRVLQTFQAVEALAPDVDARVLLTQVIHNARTAKDARDALEAQGFTVLRPTIPQREALRRSWGSPITRMFNYDTVQEALEK